MKSLTQLLIVLLCTLVFWSGFLDRTISEEHKLILGASVAGLSILLIGFLWVQFFVFKTITKLFMWGFVSLALIVPLVFHCLSGGMNNWF